MMADWTAVERCRKPPGFGRRHLLALLGFVGFALSYAMRFCLSIAIVAMANSSGDGLGRIRLANGSLSTLSLNDSLLQRHSVLFKSDICPHDTTPHETLDLKLHLYHVQTTFIDEPSRSSTEKIHNGNGIPFEVGHSNSTTNSSSNADNAGNGRNNKHLERHVATSFTDPVVATTDKTASAANYSPEEQGEFSWNEKEQGVILGSFFWGYVLTQCLGGWISQRIGGKWPFGIGLVVTGLFAFATPAATRLGGMPALIVVRIIQGLFSGVTVPAMQTILSKWFPPEERGKLGSFTFAGMPFGTSLSTLCSGYLIYYFGWPSVFYVTGVLTILWFILWSCFAFASPFEDPCIGQAELRFIQSALHGKSNNAPGGYQQKQPPKKVDVPWSRVLLSLPFWAILICNTCETWGLYTINAELPTYMKTVLHYDIKENSIMSAFPHLLTLFVSLIVTNIGDTLIGHEYVSIGIVRKVSTSIALWGSAAALLGVAYSGCDRTITIILLSAAIAANGGKFSGFLINIIDIAPNYAGILMGIINTVSSMPGFFAPWVAGMIINDNPSLENWRLVFLITAAIAFFGNLVYILFASGEVQSWNSGSSSSTDKTLQSGGGGDATPMECINQMILSNGAAMQNNKKECVDNGVYIIPLNPPVEAIEHREHHHHNPHHGGLFPLPLIAIRNVNQDEPPPAAAGAIVGQEEKSGLRCSA